MVLEKEAKDSELSSSKSILTRKIVFDNSKKIAAKPYDDKKYVGIDGKTHIFYETDIVGKQAYRIEGIKSKRTTIKEMIADANSKLKDTPKGVSSSFAENNGTVTNKNGDVVAVDSNGNTQFNIRTFEDGGRKYMERYIAKLYRIEVPKHK